MTSIPPSTPLPSRIASHTVLALVVLTAGCLGALAGDPASPTATPPPGSSGDLAGGVDCDDTAHVSFWGLSSPGETAWAPNEVRVGWTVPGGQGYFLVAYENGTRLGTSHHRSEHAVTADGDAVVLDRNLSGPHRVRVVLHKDVDDDGAFDPSVDRACREDGELVQAGPETIDFSRFEPND